MPNVSVFIPATRMPDVEALERFTDECTELCTSILKAALDKVHIIFVPVLAQGRGQDAYVEVKYRLEVFRPPEVMEKFLQAVDGTVRDRFGFTARIRCWGYGPDCVYALN